MQAEEGQCVWYGECKSTKPGMINCLYEGPSKVMTDPEGLDILRTYCPDLVTGKADEIEGRLQLCWLFWVQSYLVMICVGFVQMYSKVSFHLEQSD